MKMWEPTECPGTEELKDRLQTAREKLARQQMLLKEKKLPVLVLMEGWGTAGKGNCIGRVIQNIDPRFFNVESLEKKTEEEKRKPFLYRYFKRLPEAGKFAFFDSGWMDETVQEKLSGDLTEKTYADRIESVRRFERQLTDNGYLVMKFFLHISEKEQEKRMEVLEKKADTSWRISKRDVLSLIHI